MAIEPVQNQKVLSALSWTAPEYHHYERSSDWYWSLWIISIALSVASILLNNVLLGVLIVVGAVCVSIFSRRKPKTIKFRIDQKGVYAGETFYPYDLLHSFGIEDAVGPRAKLVLKSQKKLVPFIVILIDDATRDEVAWILNGFLPQEDHQDSLLVKVLEYLGF